MSETRVAVTGATGFVGCRLAERLVLAERYEVVGIVRRYSGSGLARLARLPVRLALADVLEPGSLTAALAGCDVVVHCAYGTHGPLEVRHRVTAEGTENVLRAAAENDVSRVLHMSTAAVHGMERPAGGVIDETTPFTTDPTPYEAAKIEAERRVWHFHEERGLPVAVFRPTLVYGPHGRRWTERIVQEIADGAWLVNGGESAANLVYVDNLVDAVMAGMERDGATGEAFIVVDDDGATWKELYEGYASQMTETPPFRTATAEEIEAMRRARQTSLLHDSLARPLALAPRVVRAGLAPREIRDELHEIPWLSWLRRTLPDPVGDVLKGEERGARSSEMGSQRAEGDGSGEGPAYPLPDSGMVELQTAGLEYDTRKLRETLGHRQRTSFPEAVKRIGDWLRYHRLAGAA